MKNIILYTLVFISTLGRAQKWSELSFRKTLERHLNAISQKDLEVIKATVSDSVTLIFPDGEWLKSKEKFVEFHVNWFKDPNWKMTTEILQIKEEQSLAYGLVKYKYISYKADGSVKSESSTYLMLLFEKQHEGWKLIHDQNTKISM